MSVKQSSALEIQVFFGPRYFAIISSCTLALSKYDWSAVATFTTSNCRGGPSEENQSRAKLKLTVVYFVKFRVQ